MSEFWKDKVWQNSVTLSGESLCDGCARCCMVKLQDEDTDEVVYTSIVCNLLDQNDVVARAILSAMNWWQIV